MTDRQARLQDNNGKCERCDSDLPQIEVPVLLGGGMGWGTMWMCSRCIAETGRKPPDYMPPQANVDPSREGAAASTVFHVVLWTEGPVGIMMSLGIEGSIATRAVADRCAEVYRECMKIGYETVGDAAQSFRTRVGVMEIPAPDPRLGHAPPRSDVEAIVKEILTRSQAADARD